jgi:hypothetical protein
MLRSILFNNDYPRHLSLAPTPRYALSMIDNAAKKQLFKVDVDFHLSSNPKVRDMFTRPEAAGEVKSFLRANNIRLAEDWQPLRGETSEVVLNGQSSHLLKFIDEFLADDPAGVYTLWYRPAEVEVHHR